jgi:hypothetical protein
MKRLLLQLLPQVVIVLLLATFCSFSFAQQQGSVTGGLNGVITDSTGAVIPGASVTLTGPQGSRALTTDSLGRFSASGLTPGFYDVSVTKEGFMKLESKHNEVVVNVSSTLNLTMQVGNVGQTVEVTAAAVGIDTQSTAITTTLTDTFYNSVPMPRNVSAIFYAAPGVAQSQIAGSPGQIGPGQANPSIGGASGLENLYVVDGVTITDQAFGSIGTYNRYHGALGTGVNLSFIKEVNVKTTAFEPVYGKALGGIVQIVTKTGGNQYHGALGAYFGPGGWYASRFQYYQFGFQAITPPSTLSSPQYDAVFELGGPVPGLKDKLFFFGSFNPQLNQNIMAANPNAPAASVALGAVTYSTTTLSWAGKLTYKLGSQTTLEASSFGDPSRHNTQPYARGANALSSPFPQTTASNWNYGSRNSVARVTSALTPSWLVDAGFAYNYNHFDEFPAINDYRIDDQSANSLATPGPTATTGLGPYEPSHNDTWSIEANTSKIFSFHGQHTFSLGYTYDHTNFTDRPSRSGPLFPIPATNAAGTPLTTISKNVPPAAIGAYTNAWFRVFATNTNPALTLKDRTCGLCPINSRGQQIYASIYRGQYSGLNVNALGRYHAAYANDVYQLNRWITLNGGVRWEQQRIGGTLLKYNFGPSWSPRVGINIDPMGDHKSKLFFNYSRTFWAMPLDAAIRQLGNEQDVTSLVFAPVIHANGLMTITPDAAHLLNGLPRSTSASGVVSKFGAPNFASSTGEGIIPGTTQQYGDEYVVGWEREMTPSIVVKARYTDRRVIRIIEDIGSQSPEGSTILAASNFVGGIANPGPSTDISVNEHSVAYTPAQFTAKNNPNTVTAANYVPVQPGCTADNDTFFAISGFFIDGRNNPVGGACILNIDTAAGPPPDGVPDGFVRPVRRYNAAEFEVDKRFSNHWLAVINYRWANLFGNFEGAYRNDNGQSDPGISSLFDFTPGVLNLLGDQFTPGFLSTDRRSVGNLFLSYNVGSDSHFLHAAKGLTLGSGLRGQSGVPLSFLGNHPAYLSQGEVPIGGRGLNGRTPSTLQLDLHTSYDVPLRAERYKLRLAMDMFNVTNSQFQLGRVQFLQTTTPAVGAPPNLNPDFNRPTAFQTPFYARGSVRFEF